MAAPILLKLPPQDPREALHRRLEDAPKEHAEALLAACDVLQGLHDKGLLELAKGALGSGEKVLEILVEAGNSPEVIRGIRNFIILTKPLLISSGRFWAFRKSLTVSLDFIRAFATESRVVFNETHFSLSPT